jgi:hypothetical protein
VAPRAPGAVRFARAALRSPWYHCLMHKRQNVKRGAFVVVLVVFIALAPAAASAQEGGGIGSWIRRSGIHPVGGYITLGLATTTAVLGVLESQYHPYVAAGTAVSAGVAVSLGLTAYGDQLSVYWPHALLAGLATTGFLTNALILQGGSPAHIATGATSVAVLYGAVTAILLLTR